MALKMIRIVTISALLALLPRARAAAPELTLEPRIASIYPLGAQPGKTFAATIRGRNLKDARSFWFPEPGVRARLLKVDSPDATTDVLHAELTVEPSASLGPHRFRIVAEAGVSNQIELQISAVGPVREGPRDAPIDRFPVSVDDRIEKRGDVNTYPIAVQSGQTITFEVISGFSGLDPSIAIAEQSGSWFDSQRINRLAFNDEPLSFPGLSKDARLVHRFDRAGKYLVQVSSSSGQGGPDYVYQLRMIPGIAPAPGLHPKLGESWEEREFTRAMGSTWMAQLVGRGAEDTSPRTAESFRAVKEGAGEVPVMTPPGIVEGRIAAPGEAHVIQVKVDQAQDLSIEVETPEATMPRFNPVVRLTEAGGNEIVTNVYTKLNNNGLYMMKMIQAKTTFSLSAPGLYTLRIRDITTDHGAANFAYRVLVRPRIPHIGKLIGSADHFNLSAGETRTLTVTLDREEEFGGVVALEAADLPAGVTAVAAMEKPVERPPLPNGGKLERYAARQQTASLLLIAAADAPPSGKPVLMRVTARPVVKGKLGDPIRVGEIPVMVIARRPS